MDEERPSNSGSCDNTKTLPAPQPRRDSSASMQPSQLPESLRQSTRFEIQKWLGGGSFGAVYLAVDRQLSRPVALKVPHRRRLTTPADRTAFLREAQAAAALRHPGIVTVYDVQDDAHGLFIVLEYVEGCTLLEYATKQPLNYEQTARVMIDVCQAVAYAHEHGLIHRDLKPANLMVDSTGRIRVTDFGLALQERTLHPRETDVVGTPTFMSPEQVRGEVNRLDARTDLWSLGVILYWLLTGKYPFSGRSEVEVFEEILQVDVRPPRQVSAAIPRELERICLKCLAKRMSERYATTLDMADDLEHWLRTSPSTSIPQKVSVEIAEPDSSIKPTTAIIPKGLRSFDQHDADFFLSLLPGPFDRQGIPESVRFWKQRIQERNPAETFSVGLMYGPSGCGKTSLLRAGVLPQLGSDVRWVYIEATAEGTEERLLRAVRRVFPELPQDRPLVETLMDVRDAGSADRAPPKLFLVFDQFEQWLTTFAGTENDSLIRALRHCDGARLQCLVMVRDDFSMAVTRFMKALEIPIVEGENCAAVDLFGRDHARSVLKKFGEAFGRIVPGDRDSDVFLDQAMDLLAEGRAVAPVRLAAFAELMRRQEWKSAALLQFGGSQGLGVALLEAGLGDDNTSLTHRQHRQAARRLLEALLPEDRTSLKGQMRSQSELMEVVGYADRPDDFQSLLDLLNKELRLISPADPQQGDWERTSSDAQALQSSRRRERFFQLTHDYLVPSLHVWLMGKQRETLAGRSWLLLDALAVEWNAKPGPRRLPTLFEWCLLRCTVPARRWSTGQRRMMKAADHRHLARLVLFAAGLIFVVGGVWQWRQFQLRQQRDDQTRALAEQLLVVDESRAADVLRELDASDHGVAAATLRDAITNPASSAGEVLRAQLFLAAYDDDARQALLLRLYSAPPQEHRLLVDRLTPHASSLKAAVAERVVGESVAEERLRGACALAEWDANHAAWEQGASHVVEALLRCPQPHEVPAWVEALHPVRHHLAPTLAARFRDENATPSERFTAAAGLARFHADEIAPLVDLALDASPELFPLLFAGLQKVPRNSIEQLRVTLSETDLDDSPEPVRTRLAKRRAVAIVALARLGSTDEFWRAVESNAIPRRRTAVLDHCRSYGIPTDFLLRQLPQANPSARQAALLVLGEGASQLSPEDRALLHQKCLELFVADPASGVHSAAESALRALGETEALDRLRRELADAPATRDWVVNSQGSTLVIVRGPREFAYGSPESEAERESIEPFQERRLEYSFALAAHEVTVEQFLRYLAAFPYATAVTSSPQCPVSNVSWVDAVRYCRWLSEQEGLPESQMCYPPLDQITPQVTLPDDWQRRTGYRLPLEIEWECACRAGTRSARFFGDSPESLDRYAVTIANSREQLAPVGSRRPNPWGLFDVYGNVLEWCQDPLVRETDKAMRSGTYRSVARENRSAKRYSYSAEIRYAFLGFRIARSVPSPTDRLLPPPGVAP